MREKYFFEIPVYTMDFNHYDETRQKELERLYAQYVPSGTPSIDKFEPIFQENHWRPWEYNQVIGWIALFVFGKDIRGDYYLSNAKRRNFRLVKKQFEYRGKAFECRFYKPCDSKEIFLRLRERILTCKDDFRGRAYINLAAFDNIGTFIKWDSLLGY